LRKLTSKPQKTAAYLRRLVMDKELFVYGHPIYTLFLEINAWTHDHVVPTHPCGPTKALT